VSPEEQNTFKGHPNAVNGSANSKPSFHFQKISEQKKRVIVDPNSATLKVQSRQKNILQSVRATKGNTQPLIVGKPKALNEKDFRVKGKVSSNVSHGEGSIMVDATMHHHKVLAIELDRHR
jgi:hypothetical protein